MTFDSEVKRHKAFEWLMANDAAFRVIVDTAALSPFHAALVAMEYGEVIKQKVARVSQQMEVTEQERIEGYPLPKDDAERLERAKVRATNDPKKCRSIGPQSI